MTDKNDKLEQATKALEYGGADAEAEAALILEDAHVRAALDESRSLGILQVEDTPEIRAMAEALAGGKADPRLVTTTTYQFEGVQLSPRNGLVELSPTPVEEISPYATGAEPNPGFGFSPSLFPHLRCKLAPGAHLPQYAHGPDEDAGLDLFALEATSIPRGARVMVRTGVHIEMPPGTEAQIRSRSGLAYKHGVRVFQGIGTVDPSYRGELAVMLENVGDVSPYHVQPGDRIAQLVVQYYARVVPVIVDELSTSDRGAAGFGSTGK